MTNPDMSLVHLFIMGFKPALAIFITMILVIGFCAASAYLSPRLPKWVHQLGRWTFNAVLVVITIIILGFFRVTS